LRQLLSPLDRPSQPPPRGLKWPGQSCILGTRYQKGTLTRMARRRVHELRYLVEIPIPYVDRRGRALDRRKRLRWQRRIEVVLTECFGGFTPAKAPAMNRVQTAGGSWMTLTEKGQVVLRSACSDRDAFLAHRERLVDLVVRMGEALAQADVFILAYDSDSLLIEVAERTR